MEKSKLQGALCVFVVLQLCYLFFFFITFPDSFRNALGAQGGALDIVASWLSTLTMVAYCILALVAVAWLVMRKTSFLKLFEIAGAIALIGNFVVFILRQFADSHRSAGGQYGIWGGDYYWTLFIAALFWTILWCLYFVRSSRVFSYMGEDDAYLKQAFFTKNVKAPSPLMEQQPVFTAPAAGMPANQQWQQRPPVQNTAPPQYQNPPPQQQWGQAQHYGGVRPQQAPQPPVYPAPGQPYPNNGAQTNFPGGPQQ